MNIDEEMNRKRTKSIIRNICISTIILFLGIILITKSFIIEPGSQDILYAYNISRNVNYTITLKENEFFEKQTLDMNKTYISSLVDKINMDFAYSFSGNKKAKTNYTYQIVAESSIKYASNNTDEDSTLWTKQYVLCEPKKMEVTESGFAIKESVEVDFATYNQEVQNFKQQLRLPAEAALQVKLIIQSDSQVDGIKDEVTEFSMMTMQMDLAQDIFKVNKNFENTDSKSIINSKEAVKHTNKPMIILGVLFVAVGLMIILDSIRKAIKFSQKSDYAIALNRILKNYGDIVAEIVSPIEVDNLNVIDVKNFEQLLDIEEEIRMPILFYETIEGEQGEFIIVCDNMAYRYVIGA